MSNRTFTSDEIDAYSTILNSIEHSAQQKFQLNLKLGINKDINELRSQCKDEMLSTMKPFFTEYAECLINFMNLLKNDDIEIYEKIISKRSNLSEEARNVIDSGDVEKFKDMGLKNIPFTEDENETIFNKGIEYFQKKEFEKAHTYISFLCLVHPKSPKLWMLNGMIYQNLGNYKKAEDSYVISISFDPTNLQTYVNLMNCLILHNKVSEAKTIHEEFFKVVDKGAIDKELSEKLDVINEFLKIA